MDIKYLFVKAKIAEKVAEELPDVLPDLSNFDNSLLRWKKRISFVHTSKGDEIKEFLLEPMDGVSWDSYIKSVVYNLMIHGAESTYKQCDKDTKKVQMFDSLPGGTVFKLKAPYFSSVCAYVQIVYGYEPQIFYNDEIVWMEYLKTSVQGQPIIPLECLITNVAEHLLFNERMASQADGTAPPEKLVIITQNEGLSGDFDKPIEIPMVKEEQDRIETKLNQPKKMQLL
jgi:hypothetical protein